MDTPAPSAEVYVMVGVVLLAVLLYLGCFFLRKFQNRSQLSQKAEEGEGGSDSVVHLGSGDDLTEPLDYLPNGTTYIHVVSASYQLPNGFRVGSGMPARAMARKDSNISEWYYSDSDSRPQTAFSHRSRRSSSVASVEIPRVLQTRLQQIADSRITEVPEVSPSPVPSDIPPNPSPSDIPPNPSPSEIAPSPEPSADPAASNPAPLETASPPTPALIANTPPLSTSLSTLVSSRSGVWETNKVQLLPDSLTDSFA